MVRKPAFQGGGEGFARVVVAPRLSAEQRPARRSPGLRDLSRGATLRVKHLEP